MYFLEGKVCENPFMELVCYSMQCKISRRSLPFLLGDYITNMSWASIISRSFMCVSEHSGPKVLNSKLEYWLSDAWVTAFLKPCIRPWGPCVFLEISSSCNWKMGGLNQWVPQGGKPKADSGTVPPLEKWEVWHTPFYGAYIEILIRCKCPWVSSGWGKHECISCKCLLCPCKCNWIVFLWFFRLFNFTSGVFPKFSNSVNSPEM